LKMSLHRSNPYFFLVKTGQVILLLLFSVFSANAEDIQAQQLFEDACTQCHSLTPIERTRNGRKGWEDTVHKMVVIGAQLNIDEMEQVIDYLYAHHGPNSMNPMITGLLPFDSPLQTDGNVSSENVVLPQGDGKKLVQAYCLMCHDAGVIVATYRKANEWQGYVENMLKRNDMTIDKGQMAVLLSYLAKHFSQVDTEKN